MGGHERTHCGEAQSGTLPRRFGRKEAAARTGKGGEESVVLAKIAEMSAQDRTMGERLHAIIKASAPGLSPKLWYGMPAYAKELTADTEARIGALVKKAVGGERRS